MNPPYTLRISARARRLQIRVLPGGRVEVVLPRGCDPALVPAFVQQQAAWIERAIERLGPAARAPLLPERIELAAIGRSIPVKYEPKGRPRLTERDGTLWLTGSQEQGRKRLQGWLQRQGREHLVPWLRRMSEELDLPFGKAMVRCQRTRWGSCSARGTISLNRNLLFLEPELVRHLFLHELCHTRHLDHSPAYWATVARFEPDYESLERRLRRAVARVPAWALP